jgi:hypothetical protein
MSMGRKARKRTNHPSGEIKGREREKKKKKKEIMKKNLGH